MNTNKQINAMVVILFIALIAVGAYSIWDTDRSESSEDDQFAATLERGATTFALNCRLCHGDAGQGGAAGGRLGAAAILDRADLQGIEDGVFSRDLFNSQFDFIHDVITCGRVGTQMPTWGESQGGTLNEEQVRQLATLITQGTWELAQEHADELDAEATRHTTLDDDDGSLDAGETELTVSSAAPFSPNQRIRIKLEEVEGEGGEGESDAPNEERMLILPEQIEVQRGVGGTQAAEHALGTEIVLATPELGEDAETGLTLSVDAAVEETALLVSDIKGIEEGEVIILDDERVRVVSITTGVPTTLQQLIEDIGKTPKRFLVSDDDGLEEGMTIRMDGELLVIEEIADDGDAGIELIVDAAAGDDEITVSEPAFFRPNYVARIGDELIRIKEAVNTDQTLGDTIGRAETSFAVSGTNGLTENMIVRIDEELMRIVSLEPARLTLERGAADLDNNASEASPHDEGDRLLELPPEPAEGEEPAEIDPADLETGAVLLENIGADDTEAVVAGTQSIVAATTFQLGNELVIVSDIQSARVKVERAVEGTDKDEHSRRAEILNGSLLSVQRGFDNTDPAAHSAGDTLNFTEVRVERAVEGSVTEDHAKGAEIFLGNTLIVERAIEGTAAAEHSNGELVLDYPRAPDGPPVLERSCGQFEEARPSPTEGPTPTPGEGSQVTITLDDADGFVVGADPTGGPAGAFTFAVTNEGAIGHSFLVIRSDLPEDGLPLDGDHVDENAVEVVTEIDEIDSGGGNSTSATLEAASYILICNVPTHYQGGMYTSFDVTP